MKTRVAILFAVLLLLSGCFQKNPPAVQYPTQSLENETEWVDPMELLEEYATGTAEAKMGNITSGETPTPAPDLPAVPTATYDESNAMELLEKYATGTAEAKAGFQETLPAGTAVPLTTEELGEMNAMELLEYYATGTAVGRIAGRATETAYVATWEAENKRPYPTSTASSTPSPVPAVFPFTGTGSGSGRILFLMGAFLIAVVVLSIIMVVLYLTKAE